MRVVTRVALHSFSQGTTCPIHLLWPLFQGHSQLRGNEADQAELLVAEQSRRKHRIKNLMGNKTKSAPQESKVVICAVENKFVLPQYRPEGIKINACQRINQFVTPRKTDLQNTQFFRIGMEAIGLRIDGNPMGRLELGQQSSQLLFVVDHEPSLP